MGLFTRKARQPVVHPSVVRRIFVSADNGAVRDQLASYDALSPRTAPSSLTLTATAGWTVVVPPRAIHPWAFHGLAMWLMAAGGGDGADVVAVAEASPAAGLVGYWLVDDEGDSWMSGYDERGSSITVNVPDNSVVRGDALSFPAATAPQVLAARGVPQPLWSAPPPDGETPDDVTDGVVAEAAAVRLEDPGAAMNPALETSYPTRAKLRRVSVDGVF